MGDKRPAAVPVKNSAWPSPTALILTTLVVIGVFAFPWLNPGLQGALFRGHDGHHGDRAIWHGDPIRPGRHHVAWLRWTHGLRRLHRSDTVPQFRPEHVGSDADFGSGRRSRGGAVRFAFFAHQRAPFRHHDLCHVRAFAHCPHQRGQVHRGRERGSICRPLGRCLASSWTNCPTPTCWWRPSCS